MDKIRDEINSPTPDPAEEIQEGIRRTEAKMSATINQIQEKLSPAHIKADAKEKVRRYALISLVKVNDAIRSKPVPAALLGVGVAWLLARKVTQRGKKSAVAKQMSRAQKQAKRQPVDTMKTYINFAKIAIAVGSAVSTYMMREREAGRSPFRRTATPATAGPQSWSYPPVRTVNPEAKSMGPGHV